MQSQDGGGQRDGLGWSAPRSDRNEGDLVVVKWDPFNAEAPIAALGDQCTPVRHFYVRSNFATPHITTDLWRLPIGGAVEHPLELSLEELRQLPEQTLTVTLECAGNDRLGFSPLPQGEPWSSGAISTATWRGVSLGSILNQAGLKPAAFEVLFEGSDHGRVEGKDDVISFARSLPVPKALDQDTLLVYEMNGLPLPSEHGGPVRLIVPDWYGVASVKWLTRITAIEQPFAGHFQADRYILDRPGNPVREPLQTMRVKSLITSHASGETLATGSHLIRGMAWSGDAPVTRVEICIGGKEVWQPARLLGDALPHAWRQWEWEWQATQPGRHVLRTRAIDEHGNIQPDVAEWNRLGYANNAIKLLVVSIIGEAT